MSKEKTKTKEIYNPKQIEDKWRKVWEEKDIYKVNLDKAKNPFYNLMMFPYPSAEGLHVGNMYAFTGADIYGRFKRMQGNDVLEPIGLDGFGIHSENYALKVGRTPQEHAKISQENFYRQLHSIGNSFDWSRKVETYDPGYYKWTQWLFIQLFKAGLAYRKKAPVNYCPSCKTVLADEQVLNKLKIKNEKLKIEQYVHVCERCGTEVEQRELEQWFFRITKYADRLLGNIEKLDWSEKVKIAQKNWIGKKEGAIIKFQISNFKFQIKTFTTRPDTLYGVTFVVVAPEHPLVKQIIEEEVQVPEKIKLDVEDYVRRTMSKSELERVAEGKEKTGVFSGIYVNHPLTDEKLPVWIADYVLMNYGTGAIMAVPAHDERDFDFAKKYNLQMKQVVKGKSETNKDIYTGQGTLINSQKWNDLETPKDMEKVLKGIEEKKIGKREVTYHLRDWLISRQRYWGPPIPMIYCEKCKWQPVPEKDLPVLLPKLDDWKPTGDGKGPLAKLPDWVNVSCPNCAAPAKRETDVSDSFLDSSWYFLRYLATDREDIPFPMKREFQMSNFKCQISNEKEDKKLQIANWELEIGNFAKRVKWLPVNMYIGGAEHSVLHLLYSRFITMLLYDKGMIDFEEPFARFYAHGLVIKDGAKMSKSRGNVIVPDQYIIKYGSDTLRTYLMFLGPFDQGGDFRDSGIEGMHKFLKRIYVLFKGCKMYDLRFKDSNKERISTMHKTIKEVTEDMENLRYNTAIAHMMEYYNYLSDQKEISQEEAEVYIKLLAPFAPSLAEELFQALSVKRKGLSEKFNSIHFASWPKYDEKYIVQDEVVIAVQVNGRLREIIRLKIKDLRLKNMVEEKAKSKEKIKKYLEGKEIKKVIYIPGKVINFVM